MMVVREAAHAIEQRGGYLVVLVEALVYKRQRLRRVHVFQIVGRVVCANIIVVVVVACQMIDTAVLMLVIIVSSSSRRRCITHYLNYVLLDF